MQGELFTLELTDLFPPNKKTAELEFTGKASDNKIYAIKRKTKKNLLAPFRECFLYQMADFCEISVPHWSALKMPVKYNGEIVFGSLWEDDCFQFAGYQVMHIILGKIKIHDLATKMSAIFAFDLFFCNPDRHFNNFLYNQHDVGRSVLAFDFSLTYLPEALQKGLFLSDSKFGTMPALRKFIQYHQFDKIAAIKIIKKIITCSIDDIEKMIDTCHKDWVSEDLKIELIAWWGSGHHELRALQVIRGIKNGKFI